MQKQCVLCTRNHSHSNHGLITTQKNFNHNRTPCNSFCLISHSLNFTAADNECLQCTMPSILEILKSPAKLQSCSIIILNSTFITSRQQWLSYSWRTTLSTTSRTPSNTSCIRSRPRYHAGLLHSCRQGSHIIVKS